MRLNKKERGQGMVEYALLIILIAMVVILALTLLCTQLSTTFSQIVEMWPTV